MPDRAQPDQLSSFRLIAMHKALTSAILHLPERERLVFTLYYYEELTKGEVGLLLGETEPSVSELYASALSQLDACFAGPMVDFSESSEFYLLS